MVRTPDSETRDSPPQPSSSKVKIVGGTSCYQGSRQGDPLSVRLTDGENTLADFAFDKLPAELLVEIFKHARPDGIYDVYFKQYPTPLAQVCRYWRSVALEAPSLWSNIYITKRYMGEVKEAARTNLERSKACPLFLTWFSNHWQTDADAQEVIDDLIVPYADRWQRITLIANGDEVADALHAVMGPLDFRILQDLEISRSASRSSGLTLCRNAPLLRRCRLRHVPSLPPLPSNLVVLDCQFMLWGKGPFNLGPWLEFLPHIAHSLEHLRFGPPTSDLSVTSRKSRITLQNLKSLIVEDSNDIMEHIVTPNLTHFAVSYPFKPDARKVAEMFHGFSAPKLQSIQFRKTPLLPLLALHDIPSMFPQLESAMFADCTDESAFIDLLKPPQPKKPSSLQKAAKYPPKHRKVENPFPKLKELTISNLSDWNSLQAVIEKRLKNGDKSLRMIRLPKEDVKEPIIQHLNHWLPKQGIDPVLHDPRWLHISTPPAFQDDFYADESRLFDVMDETYLDEEEDYEYPEYDEYEGYEGVEYWEEGFIDRPGYLGSDFDEEEEIEEGGFYDGPMG